MVKENVNKVFLVVMGLLLFMGLFFSSTVHADENNNNTEDVEETEFVINEKWGLPVYVYGSALTEKEAIKLAEDMGHDFENLETFIVDGSDLEKYLDDGAGNDASMFSSVIIERKDKGYGLEVEVNGERITEINQSQYENAMTTSGITDAVVIVDSPKAVTGESALTGIFKAFDEKGDALEDDRMKLGQEELNITTDINAENKDKSDYDVEELNAAIVDIKQQLSELEKGATKEEVEEVVNKVLDERGLISVIGKDNIQKLIDFADSYRNSSAIDSEEVKEQLKDISENVADKVGEFKDWADETGFWAKIGQFFKDIFAAISDFFSSIFK